MSRLESGPVMTFALLKAQQCKYFALNNTKAPQLRVQRHKTPQILLTQWPHFSALTVCDKQEAWADYNARWEAFKRTVRI